MVKVRIVAAHFNQLNLLITKLAGQIVVVSSTNNCGCSLFISTIYANTPSAATPMLAPRVAARISIMLLF
jgi:hypothetical protein